MSARLPADDGMLVVKALEPVADALAEQAAAGDADAGGDGAPGDDPGEDPVLGAGDRPVASNPGTCPNCRGAPRRRAADPTDPANLVHLHGR